MSQNFKYFDTRAKKIRTTCERSDLCILSVMFSAHFFLTSWTRLYKCDNSEQGIQTE